MANRMFKSIGLRLVKASFKCCVPWRPRDTDPLLQLCAKEESLMFSEIEVVIYTF